MKTTTRTFILLAAIGILSCIYTPDVVAQGSKGDAGLGVILGEPTGISGKLWQSGTRAIDLAVAWSTGKNGRLHLHSDYLIHRFDLIEVETGRLGVHYGLGARVGLSSDTDSQLGIRFPVGLSYLFPRDPFELFFEVVPVLDLLPGSEFNANGGFGIRYYFGKAK